MELPLGIAQNEIGVRAKQERLCKYRTTKDTHSRKLKTHKNSSNRSDRRVQEKNAVYRNVTAIKAHFLNSSSLNNSKKTSWKFSHPPQRNDGQKTTAECANQINAVSSSTFPPSS